MSCGTFFRKFLFFLFGKLKECSHDVRDLLMETISKQVDLLRIKILGDELVRHLK
jgi:hypothetical protein